MCLAKYADVVELEAPPELYGELNVPLSNADTAQETFAKYARCGIRNSRCGKGQARLGGRNLMCLSTCLLLDSCCVT